RMCLARELLSSIFQYSHLLLSSHFSLFPYTTLFRSLYNLENEKLIVSREGFQTRQDIFNEFRKLGIVPNIIFEIERFETACSLVGEGLGITVIPESYMRFNFASNSFVIKPINSQHLFRTVYIAYIKSRYLPPIVETFLNLTKSSFADETNKEI